MGLEILESNEAWETVDDWLEFSHTKVILRDGPQYFYAKTDSRISTRSEIEPLDLELHPIPTLHIWPKFPQNYTRALDATSPHVYVKRPSLMYYGDGPASTQMSTLILREAQICEVLASFPHPNVAKYLGCEVQNGMITGLCFEKYGIDLFRLVSDGQEIDTAVCLKSIREGIKHLHSLGLVHGDINPHNVLSHGENFVIADFDSCTKQGEERGLKGGTKGWTLDYSIAERRNDWYGLSKIEEFLDAHSENASVLLAHI